MPPKNKVEYPGNALRRVIIESVEPEVDAGRFPAKATIGPVRVECDAFADGHDAIAVVLLYRAEGKRRWEEVRMTPVVNDRWRGTLEADRVARYEYTIEGWVDPWATWRAGMAKWLAARVDVETHLAAGAELLAAASSRAAEGSGASGRAAPADAQVLRELSELLV
ncbi:MAG: DUF3416 domain-containing protein, partial [Gemmatimonadetes bacterium]|nr:DUF3416 domain-containing protein [Gemmatimonadota bacterium]